MNDGITISSYQFHRMFPDEASARIHLEEARWGGQVVCPHCESDHITTRRGQRLGYYRCRGCDQEFTVRTGTIFERSHVRLHEWLYAIYLTVTARKGLSSLQLSKVLGRTQKTAWFIQQRLREACAAGELDGLLTGIVEVDEAYVGGREGNRHERKKRRAGRGPAGKQAVLGLRQRNGKSIARPVSGTSKDVLQSAIARHVAPGSTVYTDDHPGYTGLRGYRHRSVRHSAGEYVGASGIHINSAESMWATLKRSVYGTWHQISRKHMHRYVNEVAFRLNEGNCTHHTLIRMAAFVEKSFQRRITYRELIAAVDGLAVSGPAPAS